MAKKYGILALSRGFIQNLENDDDTYQKATDEDFVSDIICLYLFGLYSKHAYPSR